ncbi:MAG TPA: two-component regulator propeller domain-containing protein [Acidobacteriaceae bacterium]|nr:two-component regulator propeller domain-containing protein [Acidobacteriaceae bacterium]
MKGPIRKIVLSLAVICLSCPAHAIDPNRSISQYLRERWFSDRGFNDGAVTALTQTRDGYLWIGTDKGLIRFDGSSFRAFQRASPTTFPIGPVQALMTDAQGGLWIILQSTQILRYSHGNFELGHDEAEFGITSIAGLKDGTVVLSSLALGPLKYAANRYQVLTSSELPAETANHAEITADNMSSRLSSATGVATHRFAEPDSPVISMAQTADGKVWLGTRDKGLFYISQGRVLSSGKKLPSTKVNCLVSLQNGELWIGTDGGLVKLAESTSAAIPPSLRNIPILAMIQDRDANVWVGTAAGLFRLNANGVSVDRRNTPVTALFEDREGNVWIGSSHGIECLRDSAFVTYSPAGLNSESSGAIYVDPYDRVWYAPIEGGLRWMKGEQSGTVTNDLLSQDVIYSITGSKDELWVGRQQGGLTHLRFTGASFSARTYTERNGLAQNSVYTVHQNPDGTVWAGTVSGGVSKLNDGRFTTYTVADGLGANTVTSIEDSPNGTMWFGTSGGLTELAKGSWRTYTTRDGLPADNVSSILRDSAGTLWIGTTSGLAFLSSGHVSVAGPRVEVLREPILGLADDQGGSLWIATSNHVLRISRDRLLQGHPRSTDIREYGHSDGLRGTQGVKRDRSVVKDLHGDIWFSLHAGLSMVHPARANQEVLPAVARVENVLVDGNPVALQGPVRIPSSQRRLMIDYSALCLVGSDRLRFRYRLDGFDHGWSEPVTSRQAIYTNLGPGSYQFRVAASNSDGVWNGVEATLPFRIDPAFWQAWWFRLSSLLCLAAFTWLIYRLRLHHISRQFDMRVEERTAERTRIARELHDSLLQGFQGLLLHLQAAQHMLPARPQDAKQALEKVLDQGDQALAEARSAVQNLRASAVIPNDLPQALAAIGKELAVPGNTAQFRVMVEGKAQNLDPILRDEVYRFAREALRNAFGHAQAENVEAEIAYGELRFVLRVRDDGVGIDPKVLDRGSRPGHWGLPGMRERAESLGGQMEVWSESGAGTEIQLTIPAAIAYQEPIKRERFRFFRSKRTTLP